MKMSNIFLPEHFKVVTALSPQTSTGAKTFDNIQLRDAIMVWIVAEYTQAATHVTTIQPVVGATDGGCTNAITFSARWWKNADVAATDTLVAQTAGTVMTCTAGVSNQLLIMQIDPSDVVAQNATYDWLGGTQATSGQASNFVSVTYFIQTRMPQATPRSAIA
jgi:hypothetical protein